MLSLAAYYYALKFNLTHGSIAKYSHERFSWRWVLLVGYMESGDLSSNLYKNANNVFGMRVPSSRKYYGSGSYDTGSNGLFAKYRSVWQCVRDWFEWLEYNSYHQQPGIRTFYGLVQFMQSKGYCANKTAQEYYDLCVSHNAKVDKVPNPMIGLGAAFSITITLIVLNRKKIAQWIRRK